MSNPSNTTGNTAIKKPRRRRYGLPIIILFFIVMAIFSRQTPIKTIICTSEIIASKPDVIMLGAWWCTYCYQAKKYFQKNQISYCEYDMENTEKGKLLYQQHGAGPVPILLIGEHRLSGYNQDQIELVLDILHSSTADQQ